jgi:hypothetical protein
MVAPTVTEIRRHGQVAVWRPSPDGRGAAPRSQRELVIRSLVTRERSASQARR